VKGRKPVKNIPLFKRMQVESQSICNRSCWFCPRTYDRSGAYIHSNGNPVFKQMPSEKILDLLDQAQKLGFQGDVTFYFYSELLLDKRNLMFAEQSKKRNMNPYIYTNGDLRIRLV
jgi:2-deoxy-scyllo-inosamine dehydrogenase (SAM-dependent)/8-amino-3,8-dideoxy-alpha-D-manno-octulosonate transaminase